VYQIQKGADLKCVASKACSRDGVLSVLKRLRYHGSLLWTGKSLISAKCPHQLWDTPGVLLSGHRQSVPWGKAARKLITHIRPVPTPRTRSAVHPLTFIPSQSVGGSFTSSRSQLCFKYIE